MPHPPNQNNFQVLVTARWPRLGLLTRYRWRFSGAPGLAASSIGLASGSSFTVLPSESVAVVVITSEELLADEVSSDVGRI